MRVGRGDSRPGASRPTPAPRCIGGATARVESIPLSVRIARNAPRNLEAQYRLTTDRCTVAVQFLSLSGTPRRW